MQPCSIFPPIWNDRRQILQADLGAYTAGLATKSFTYLGLGCLYSRACLEKKRLTYRCSHPQLPLRQTPSSRSDLWSLYSRAGLEKLYMDGVAAGKPTSSLDRTDAATLDLPTDPERRNPKLQSDLGA